MSNNLLNNQKIIITICARGGSKGVPGKNIKPLFGKPLIIHTIEQAKRVINNPRIIVSTDNPKIKAVAEKAGVEVPFLRNSNLAKDDTPKVPVIIDAVKRAEQHWQENYNIVLDLDPTSPLRNLGDIHQVLTTLVETPNTETVFTVNESYKNPYFNMVELDQEDYAHLSKTPDKAIGRRQDAPKVFTMNASIYAMWKDKLFARKTFFTDQTRVYVMPEERSVDIDRSIDFKIVELLMKEQI